MGTVLIKYIVVIIIRRKVVISPLESDFRIVNPEKFCRWKFHPQRKNQSYWSHYRSYYRNRKNLNLTTMMTMIHNYCYQIPHYFLLHFHHLQKVPQVHHHHHLGFHPGSAGMEGWRRKEIGSFGKGLEWRSISIE
jgi:hypothetical protein